MKRYLFYGLMLALALNMAACHKDTGNYTYHSINQITFSNIDTVNGYQVTYGNVLNVAPTINATMDANLAGSYTYQWSWSIINPVNGYYRDSIIATTKALANTVKLTPGVYSLQYRVTDNGTGVTYHVRANVNVVTDVYEGYMLLNDVGGQSRLSMLSYNKAANTFTQYNDVLQKMGSTVPMNGAPYQVYCAQFLNPGVSGNYGIFILNGAGCNRVDQETFVYNPTLMNIKNLFIGTVPSTFTPIHMVMEGAFGLAYPVIYMFDNTSNMYSYATFNGSAFHYAPLNVYTAAGTPFKMPPYGATNGSAGVFYNADKKNFVSAASYNSVALTDAAASLKYPTGLNLVFLDKDYNNNVFAIMKDPATSKMYLIKFAIGGAATVNQDITGAADIATATQFALSPQFGYVFYSSGGKLYEYDPGLQTSFLMFDRSPSTITHLSFQHFFNRTTSTVNKANYGVWANYLSMATYGSADGSGTFELYSVPSLNQVVQKQYGWTGFGKIVSSTYRER